MWRPFLLARHRSGIARSMAHRVDDDLRIRDFIENQVGVWARRQATDAGLIREFPHKRMVGKLLNQCLDPLTYPSQPQR